MPRKASKIFGADGEWRDFMEFKKIKREKKCSDKKALIELAERQVSSVMLVDGRRTYETGIKRNINSIEEKIMQVYPKFNF